jgi:glycosyltransferase involved in cell wall biosynthesis
MAHDTISVLHLLNTSLPLINGYGLRSHSMLTALAADGVENHVITSPFQPGRAELAVPTSINGIKYLRCPHPLDDNAGSIVDRLARPAGRIRLGRQGRVTGGNRSRRQAARRTRDAFLKTKQRLRLVALGVEQAVLVRRFARTALQLAHSQHCQIIHAHSPARIFKAAHRVAKACRLPVVYEARGMQEATAVAERRVAADDPLIRRWRDAETQAMKLAQHVIVLGEAMRSEVLSRGISGDKITVVPNGCNPMAPIDDSTFAVQSASRFLQQNGALAVGLVGSIQRLEGVLELIEAVARLKSSGIPVRLLLVGSTRIESELKAVIQERLLDADVLLMDAVPPAEALAILDLLDVTVVARQESFVSRLVTPLKPLDAMSQGCCVIMSDLPASREIILPGKTGCLVDPNDINSLVDTIRNLAVDRSLCSRLGAAGQKWAQTERTWAQGAAIVKNVYMATLNCNGQMR